MHPMLTIAVRAARSAGDQIIRSADSVGKLQINTKGSNDVSLEIKRRALQEIIQIIQSAYPEHKIITEKTDAINNNENTWLIDPLNGASNFMHGFPLYAVSIALKVKNKLEVAVVFNPVSDELFTASRGGGAMLNNRKIRVSRETSLKKSLLASGLPFKSKQKLHAFLDLYRDLFNAVADIRHTGSAALDLAYLASSRFDGLCQIGANECSIAAGTLLVQEAGGVITDFSFNDQYIKSGNLIAAAPRMHQAIYQAIATHFSDESG
jgi:myo-inositol-1(or 4)-monophosphatase